MIIPCKDLDDLGLNDQTFCKVIERPKDDYTRIFTIHNNLPFSQFTQYTSLSSSQLKNIHRKLGHLHVEKQMKVIEQAEMENLPEFPRREIEKIVKYCSECQCNKTKPTQFLFSIQAFIECDFIHIIQRDVVALHHVNILYIIYLVIRFGSTDFIIRLGSIST